jgi:hypothetical protein
MLIEIVDGDYYSRHNAHVIMDDPERLPELLKEYQNGERDVVYMEFWEWLIKRGHATNPEDTDYMVFEENGSELY